jgi:ATPase subunit of ABC transporter with duplicated ATPase domains
MSKNDSILNFDEVSYEYHHIKPILVEASFTLRRGRKVALMGQNGAGKSTIFSLITKEKTHDSGSINIAPRTSIAIAKQVIPREQMTMNVREFFEACFEEKIYNIDPRIDSVLEVVNLHAPHDKLIKEFSGGQQARLLLASALIQDPELLLLDEPTNNLDKAGIEHLTEFLKSYTKTVMVISHDAEFLNAFTHGVLYLDVHTKKIEQYEGNYFDAVEEISLRVQKENRKNAQLAKEIQANKDKANFFAMKGGKMRLVAKKMREQAEEAEENKVDVRKEDKTIRPFNIPVQEDLPPEVLSITSYQVIKKHAPKIKKANISIKKRDHVQLIGPNGIGKTTLLEALAGARETGGVHAIAEGVRVGYYRQDFSTLNFDDSVFNSLMNAMEIKDEEKMRATASGFLINAEVIKMKIGSLSEGQKGLVAFAQLVLQRPGLLILDEPTNHINFRHLPVIAKALDQYDGPMIIVSHVPEFIQQIRIDEVVDLEK